MIKKATVSLFVGVVMMLPFAGQARAQNILDGLRPLFSSLTGGNSNPSRPSSSNDQAQQIGQSVTDIVHEGQNIGQQAQDIAHQF